MIQRILKDTKMYKLLIKKDRNDAMSIAIAGNLILAETHVAQ